MVKEQGATSNAVTSIPVNHIGTYLPLDPKAMKNEGFSTPQIWVITPKNEGYGFPWFQVNWQLRTWKIDASKTISKQFCSIFVGGFRLHFGRCERSSKIQWSWRIVGCYFCHPIAMQFFNKTTPTKFKTSPPESGWLEVQSFLLLKFR